MGFDKKTNILRYSDFYSNRLNKFKNLRKEKYDKLVLGIYDLNYLKWSILFIYLLYYLNVRKTYIIDTKGRVEKITLFFLIKSTFLTSCSLIFQLFYLLKLPFIVLRYYSVEPPFFEKKVLLKNLNVAYLRTNDTYNLKSGGSLGHTLGVINGFSKTVKSVHFFGIDSLSGIKNDVSKTIITQNKFFNYVNISNRFITSNLFVKKIKKFFLLKKYDVIYQRLSRDDISGAILSKIFKIPLVIEYNSSMTWEVTNSSFIIEKFLLKITVFLEKFTLNQATSIIAVSKVLKEELNMRGYKKNVYVVTNGVDPELFTQSNFLKINKKFEKKTKVVCFSGTFGFWHGINIMEDAIHILNKEKVNCEFLLIGDGLYRKDIEASLKKYTNITFTGSVNFKKIASYLSKADIFLSPHNLNKDKSFIGSPTKLFEYMSLGKIIIGSDLDQISSILYPSLKFKNKEDFNDTIDLNDQLVGILTSPGDAQLLAMSIKYAIQNYNKLQFMGQNAQTKIHDKYTWDIKVNEILKTVFQGNEK
jgi:glycosyltransferase involved in cell wall biosynthesis